MPVIPALEAHNTGGRLATRLIEDWYHGILQHADKSDPRTQSCYHLRGNRPAPAGVSDDHDLITVPSQTNKFGDQSVISCFCRHCRYHFALTWPSKPPVTGPDHLQHHLVIVGITDESFGEGRGKDVLGPRWDKRLFPLVRHTIYQCSSCDFSIRLDVTAPRLDNKWIDIVTDESRAKRNLKMAMKEDPARFRDMTQEKLAKLETGALLTLNMYITNIMSSDPSTPETSKPEKTTEKKISERNKTFMVQFGPACEELFLYLGFKKRQEVDEAFYISPREPPKEGGKTDLYSERAFFEDVKSEIQSVIDQKLPHHVQPHSSARHDLETALGCADVTKLDPGYLKEEQKHYFCLLGASLSSTDATLKWAYERQIAVDPDHKRYYVEALSQSAFSRGEELQMFAIAEQESAPASSKTPQETSEYDKDWDWFSLSRETDRTSDKIVQRYHEYRDREPPNRHLHREHLARIGRDLGQQDLIDMAGKDMDDEEAYNVLGVLLGMTLTPDTELDFIANAAANSVNEGQSDLAVVVAAMDVIGMKNMYQAGSTEYAEFEKICGALTARLHQYNATGKLPPPHFIEEASGSAVENSSDGDLTLPAGLGNLRNTCYLNSILQYLYTVDVIRDLLKKLDLDTLEGTTEKMKEILGGAKDDDRNETWLGHEFARELETLFQEMEESTSVHVLPRQRLANAALASAKKPPPSTVTESKNTESKATASKSTESKDVPPPLPPRNGEEVASVEHVETASTSSSQTLIGESTPATAGTTGTEGMEGVEVTKETAGTAGTTEDATGGSTEDTKTGTGGTAETKSTWTVELLAERLDNQTIRGTDQQDVDEAMGNILEHLQAAVKLAVARLEDGEEKISDPIAEHFYTYFVNTRKKRNEVTWGTKDDNNRFVMAYPHVKKGVKRDLYQAIGHGLDVQLTEGKENEDSWMHFTAIKKPADILHVLIPRNTGGGKNENPVKLNDPFYLDHFMEVEDTKEDRFRMKARLWAINRRLEELRAGKSETEQQPVETDAVLVEEDMDRFLGVDLRVDTDGDYELVDVDEVTGGSVTASANANANNPKGITVTPERLREFSDWLRVEEANEEEQLRREREAILADGRLQKLEYRLHAVFCHRGGANAGHYWVWIRDFERGVWRKYNDATVTVSTEEEFRREVGDDAEEPCLAAYVRAGRERGLVSVPLRKGVEKEAVEAKVRELMSRQKGEDVEMGDVRSRGSADW
ncbi:hypothetical protein B0T21DRAFT_54104 [Apiosordaria backusii]|uniref:ubiquitinyl hydrolase 1 n=1 Tax=Apiosordaria backusii TaxID=314023 RepID=A0AA40DYU6_9PEZI|nr:hypothetical protein B0T21DRAFT_54104 [Apiosordaria backusii]